MSNVVDESNFLSPMMDGGSGSMITKERRRSSVISMESGKTKYMPPWTTPYIIGIGGTSGSGKTSVAAKIVSSIDVPWTVLISMDNFYKPLNQEDRKRAFANEYDFDEPAAIDTDLAYECILSLKEGKKTTIPVYSFINHNRDPDKSINIYGASVIIIEGLYALYDKRLMDLMDLKIFVDADLDVCLARRLSRDIVSRGRDLAGCIQQWERFVKPDAVKYIRPTMGNADAIVPSLADNSVAVQLLISHIRIKLRLKSQEHLSELIKLGNSDLRDISTLNTVHVLEQTNQVRSIMTMLLDKNLKRDDFVFYFDRISSILVSNALNDIPIKELVTIETPEGNTINDAIKCDFNSVMAVNIIRSGDCFMRSLKNTIPSIVIGKLLIQSDSQTGEPQLHCEFLPPEIKEYKTVFLMEAHIITGAASIMAIQVLLDHDIPLENIKLVVFIATELGIKRILNAFNDKINIFAGKIVTTKEIQNEGCEWSITKFIDTRYFGCN
ncbi:hypothetical protein Kpol_1060p10 [Vanderwaltozyma polyspora DSM 70294]|uniref:Uridine kinase n=1 Tax=Vanderwaltozyma polyspora (strain ATCC 22028 / DSM 70294 / BCRC 21397 / CBS 2163 / NBRC 10782 / NRRL Y-8283 / UCD 57-17) TaxID=436907 RepID=A7TK10_VANPO|nr:uncharacterized protein Kpol_1060p10 [Vanderwaltozyma polyspora DSM 70294]EDO17356.1 hypothetical protein Kpol_1060p10 [Vanderwaltozyma polyspora DSM 70294]